MTRLVVSAALGLALAISPAMAQPGDGVAWGDREHESTDTLARWLAERGAAYESWAERHPAAAAWLEGRELDAGSPVGTRPVVIRTAEASSGRSYGWLVALVASAGCALLAIAWTLSLPPWRARLGPRLRHGQGALALAGVGLLVSVAVGYGLTLL